MDFMFNELKLAYEVQPPHRYDKVTCSGMVADMLLKNWDDINYTESFKVVFLNNSNNVIGVKTVSTGGLTSVIVDVRVVFAAALVCGATNIILAHNHPSGRLVASSSDRSVTEKFKQAGEILDIRVTDHLILTKDDHYSFLDQGIL